MGKMKELDIMLKTDYKLYIFDLDGTLSEFKTGKILEGVKEWFSNWLAMPKDERPYLAIASNQGGVGKRYWMESGKFGNPENYPTESDIQKNFDNILAELGLTRNDCVIFTCYMYQSQKGYWNPVPDDKQELPEWSANHRKPKAGMLLDAMNHHKVLPEGVVMIGDWDEDRSAAINAGCDFIHANDFFNRHSEDDWIPF